MIHKHQKIKEKSSTRYRTWKKGKNWCYSFSVLAALTGGAFIISDTVNADTGAAGIPAPAASSSPPAMLAAEAISSDITFYQSGQTVIEQQKNTTLTGGQYAIMGIGGTYTVNSSDLVDGNIIEIAKVSRDSTGPNGELVNFGNATPLTQLDSTGAAIGTIYYDADSKAFVLVVSATTTVSAATQTISFTSPGGLMINVGTPNTILSQMPFSNTITVSGKSYNFDFVKLNSYDAAHLESDYLSVGNNTLATWYIDALFHEDITGDAVLAELQESAGAEAEGVLKGNTGVLKSLKVSNLSDYTSFSGAISLGVYYVSAAAENKIQALDNQSLIAVQSVGKAFDAVQINCGNGKTTAELKEQAVSGGTGIYYSHQDDGTILLVEYISPEDTVLTDEQIESAVRANLLASTSPDIDADVKATLAYYHGKLQNRSSYIQFNCGFIWADEYVSNTLTVENLDNGEIRTNITVPNAVASDSTPVKTHYVDLNGNVMESTSIITKAGPPTGKDNDLGDPGTSSATVDPIEIPGYTLVTDITKLTAEQRMQLEATLSSVLDNNSAVADQTQDKTIFATKSLTVPYPGYANKYYDADGHIVTDGSGAAGYGQTDVYYFYVANPQEVVYNVIDDTTGTNLEANADFDNGFSNENLNKSQQDLQNIADGYIPGGYEVVSVGTIPGAFDNNDAVNQVVNIHLKHIMKETVETEKVNETIHYVYASDNSKAADDYTDSVTFTRTATTDQVTKKTTYTAWTAKDSDTTFEAVPSPPITNYTPDKLSVAAVTELTPDSADIELTVKYTANTKAVTDTQEVVRNIHYVYEDNTPVGEAAPDRTETLTFTRTGTKNLATGCIIWDAWTGNSTSFDEALSPTVKGYTPDRASVSEVTGVTAESEDYEITVTYVKDEDEVTPLDDDPKGEDEDTPDDNPKEDEPDTPVDEPKTPGKPSSSSITTPKAETKVTKTVLPSTGDENRNSVGGFTLLGAAILGVVLRLKRKK